MSASAPSLRVCAVGRGTELEDLTEEHVVVLTGTVEAVRLAAKLFGRDVLLTAAEKDEAGHD